ncbi:hypothetical protein HanPSC8_Chr12g0503901 [Helianthus annuus]|nr:hypothetical protein HanPSC8_Chr13g0550891 [Helianthus annuus]KAJ0861188.1 hypothetical protein HanPSC8_Chr12g0503901 [Helianthus annuus]
MKLLPLLLEFRTPPNDETNSYSDDDNDTNEDTYDDSEYPSHTNVHEQPLRRLSRRHNAPNHQKFD